MDVVRWISLLITKLIRQKTEKIEEKQVDTDKKEPKKEAKIGFRRINSKGLELIKRFEGLEFKAYYCPAGVLTIGYGSTGPHVKEGMRITEIEAVGLLKHDLERFEKGVTKLVTVPLTHNQYSAIVSFAFNVGLANLKSSTLLRKLNAGDYEGAANEFPRWNKAKGQVLAGLTRRRNAEKNLFLSRV